MLIIKERRPTFSVSGEAPKSKPEPRPPATIVVKTLHGLEPVLAEEIKNMGGTDVAILKRAVSFTGDKTLIYRANYELRTAMRVLVPITQFFAQDERQFYGRVRDIDWSHYLDSGDSLAVDAVAAGSIFRHSQYMALTTKDAIVDQFRDRVGRRPNVDLVAPTVRVNVKINENHCELHLDSSNESLHKRGYRKEQVEAPINEVLAAGMLLLAGWNGSSPFIDPMCGSGTLPIEAAFLAKNIPPGKLRAGFGFFKWKDFDQKLWHKVKTEADAREQSLDCQIFASDKEGRARNITAINVMAAGLEKDIFIERKPFENLLPPTETPGILMANPPYDERLKVEQIHELYAMLGERLKHRWPGWQAWLISSNREAMNHFGLRPSRKFQLYNGPLECYFQKFDLYEGKKGSAEIED